MNPFLKPLRLGYNEVGIMEAMSQDGEGVLREKVIGFEYTNVIESELKPMFL